MAVQPLIDIIGIGSQFDYHPDFTNAMMLMIGSAHPSTANRPQRRHDPYFWNDWVACSREWAYDSTKYATLGEDFREGV